MNSTPAELPVTSSTSATGACASAHTGPPTSPNSIAAASTAHETRTMISPLSRPSSLRSPEIYHVGPPMAALDRRRPVPAVDQPVAAPDLDDGVLAVRLEQ